MLEVERLVRKLAETRETLRQMSARFGDAPAMRIPIARLREQEARLVQMLKSVGALR